MSYDAVFPVAEASVENQDGVRILCLKEAAFEGFSVKSLFFFVPYSVEVVIDALLERNPSAVLAAGGIVQKLESWVRTPAHKATYHIDGLGIRRSYLKSKLYPEVVCLGGTERVSSLPATQGV
jgi:hypothetical protein